MVLYTTQWRWSRGILLEQISFIESVYCERKWWVLTARQNWEHFLHSVITVFLLLKFEQRKGLANNHIRMYILKGRNGMLWIKSWLVDRAHCPPFCLLHSGMHMISQWGRWLYKVPIYHDWPPYSLQMSPISLSIPTSHLRGGSHDPRPLCTPLLLHSKVKKIMAENAKITNATMTPENNHYSM